MPGPHDILAENRAAVAERIARAARRADRPADAVRLLAVTKTVPAETCAALLALGQRDLGENRIDVLEAKREVLGAEPEGPRWHFIGHIQRNKARRVVRAAEVIHSVDSPRLLDTLERVAAEEGRSPEVYLEVNASGEAEKHGLALDAVAALVAEAAACRHLRPVGLMAMGPLAARGGAGAEEVFGRVARLAAEIEGSPALAATFPGGRVRLSMGMSADLEAAVGAGSDWVRVGSALFRGLEGVRGLGQGPSARLE